MKHVSRYILLCAIFALFASPGWAGNFKELQDMLKAGGTINLTMDYKWETSNPTSFDISRPVTINGNGHTIDGNNSAGPVLRFKSSSDGSSVTGITFKNCSADINAANQGGAAIYIDGVAVTVEDCTFKDNKFKSHADYGGGGAIYTKDAKEGTVIKNCRFENNVVSGTGNEYGGGAIYNLSTATGASLTITDCQFYKNGETKVNASSSGGAISNVIGQINGALSITLTNCSFDSNQAPRYGGAVYNLTDTEGTVTAKVENCTFTNNKLDRSTGNGSVGGAIGTYAFSGNITIDVSNTLFKNNQAYNTGVYSADIYFGCGGGAFGTFTNIKDHTVKSTLKNCRFEANEANFGGAITNWGHSATADMTIENCTFVNNKATANTVYGANTTPPHYPRGGAVLTRATKQDRTTAPTQTNIPGTAKTKIINSTFTGNSTESGGAIGVYKANNSGVAHVSETTIYNCTFANNTLTGTDTTSGVEAYNDGGTLSVTNTVFYNPDKTLVTNANTGTVTLKNSAYNGTLGTAVTADTATKANAVFTNAASETTAKATINGVEHTVFKLTESDTATTGGTTGTNIPTTDQLGVTRSTTAPSIGAVEYVTLAVSTTTLPEGTVDTAYKEELKATFTPKQSDAELKWDLKSGSSLPDGLSLDISGVISGTPTTANTYSFTLTVAVSGDLYSVYSADKEFTLTINEKPEVSFDIGTVTIKSTGGSVDIDIELVSTDYSDSAKTSSSDLTSVKTATLTVGSSDQAKVVVTIDAGDGEIEAVLLGTTSVTVTDDKFTPSAAGTYKIIFTGTDDNDNVKYFAAGFTYSIVDDTEDTTNGTSVSSQDVTGTAGSYKIQEGIKIKSPFTNTTGTALVTLVNSFFRSVASTSSLVTADDMSAILTLMGDTADDVGDDTTGRKIIGTKLNKKVPARTPFLVILIDEDDNVHIGVGVTQMTSDIFVIKFELLQDANNTSNAFLFPRGKYTVGATDSSEYLNTAEDAEDAAAGVLKSAKSAAVFFLSDDTDTIGSISFGDLELAGTKEEDISGSSKGSSSGCDTGISGLAVLIAAALALKKRKA